MHAKGSSSEKLSIRMRNPCNRQLISIHVRLKFLDSSVRGFFAKNRVPMFEEPLRQFRDVFGVLTQVANPNSTHTNSVFGQRELDKPRQGVVNTLRLYRNGAVGFTDWLDD